MLASKKKHRLDLANKPFLFDFRNSLDVSILCGHSIVILSSYSYQRLWGIAVVVVVIDNVIIIGSVGGSAVVVMLVLLLMLLLS